MLTRKIKLWDINAHITCRLCSGYLIDATTVTECLHTFCRSCLVKYLEENNTCPTCRIVIHQSHPLQYIGHDRTMQDIVYKLVPGLQEAEMRKQREFYHKLGMEVPGDIKGETCSAKQHLDSHRNGETKADDSSNKEAAEEKPEEDNDYHRSDEQLLSAPLGSWDFAPESRTPAPAARLLEVGSACRDLTAGVVRVGWWGAESPCIQARPPGRGRGRGWKERLLDCRGEAGGSELGTGAKLPHVPWAVSSGQSERAKVGDLGGPW
uniref:Polycomb group ring finger 3 n=1 Tax=Macaca mulatta TaxID=9544 RepID=A0A5F7ZK28_MACMU